MKETSILKHSVTQSFYNTLCLYLKIYLSGGIAFYWIGILTSFIFLSIAYKWNKLLQLFEEVDNIFCRSPYTLTGWSLKTRIRVLIFTVTIFAFSEHLLALYSFVHDRIAQAEVCKWEIESWFYYITSLHLAHIYKLFPVRIYSVLWAEFTDLSFTYVWNYIDLFIMVMSMSIATKFKMINERLKFFKGRVSDEIVLMLDFIINSI